MPEPPGVSGADRAGAAADPRKGGSVSKPSKPSGDSEPHDLPGFLGLASVWLVVAMTVSYVACFEPAYKSEAVCRAERWTRVVVDPPLAGVKEPVIAIGSNAGYVIVVSGCECPRRAAMAAVATTENGDLMLDWLQRQISDRWSFLFSLLSGRTDLSVVLPGGGRLVPRAAVVPLSRVVCMYDVPSRKPDEQPACKPRTPLEQGPQGPRGPRGLQGEQGEPGGADPRSEERLRREIQARLSDRNVRCVGEPGVSPAIVFRPDQSELADAAEVDHALEALSLGDAERVKLYVFGFASADGRPGRNKQLSQERADTVRRRLEEIKQEDGHEWNVAGETFAMGEDHLASGVAESRSARLVACVPPD